MAASFVYVNVEDHKLLDTSYDRATKGNQRKTVGDITKVTIPAVSHPTTTISASGMVMDVDMPNLTHMDAMELTIEHNNGENHEALINPGVHTIEFRIARQKYGVKESEISHESVKYRFTCVHKSSDDGGIETNNPIGSSEKFSVLKYERIVNGVTEVKIDAMSGVIEINGKKYSDQVQNLLK